MAHVEVLSLMQNQAVAFDLPLSDLSLDGLDPERDLTGPSGRMWCWGERSSRHGQALS